MSAPTNIERILNSPSYRLAFQDLDYLGHEALRPVRLQLELLKPEIIMNEAQVRSTIVVFGSARIIEEDAARQRLAQAEAALRDNPGDKRLQQNVAIAQNLLANAHYYDQAREFARLVTSTCQIDGHCDFVIVTGGGPGIMEAANRGAYDVAAKSVGLNITLPHEQAPNEYITPELCFNFQYFAIRKMHFLLRAKALVVFPGGFGTLDELFEALTLVQTQRMARLPILLFGKSFWEQAIDFQFLVDQGTISPEDLDLFHYVETAEEAWSRIVDFYRSQGNWPHFVDDDSGKNHLYNTAVEKESLRNHSDSEQNPGETP